MDNGIIAYKVQNNPILTEIPLRGPSCGDWGLILRIIGGENCVRGD